MPRKKKTDDETPDLIEPAAELQVDDEIPQTVAVTPSEDVEVWDLTAGGEEAGAKKTIKRCDFHPRQHQQIV